MTDKLQVLLEEWKQNVALYIDQDKRGLERIKMFLTVNGGLLVAWGVVWKPPYDLWSTCAGAALAIMGLYFTYITKLMSTRAHWFILLRKNHAMLIEGQIKELLAPDDRTPWRTSSGIVTTFTREHNSFRRRTEILPKWQESIQEMEDMDKYALDPLLLDTEPQRSMRHLEWLMRLHNAITCLWVSVFVLTVAPQIPFA